jgi:uncharacterized repeat protein (TIGR01451 family)
VTVTEGDSLTATPVSFTPVESQRFSGVVGAFSDSNPSAAAGDFTANIDWGDGTTSAGSVATGPGGFVVNGSHKYAEDGTYAVAPTITDDGAGTTVATLSSSAVVSETELGRQAMTITPIEGVQFSGTVATFTDPNSQDGAAGFSATIDWGDGTTDTGVVSGTNGAYSVSGAHTYQEEGSFSITLGFSENNTPTFITNTTSTANVQERSLSVAADAIAPIEGSTFAGEVAAFSDAGSTDLPVSFAATIDWGDGTTPTTGTIGGSDGNYTVSGSHIYADEGPFTVSVSAGEGSPPSSSIVARNTATVGEGDTAVASPAPIAASEGQAFSGTVLQFTDAGYPNQVAGDFTAQINWGDGATSQGTVTGPTTGGQFAVAGGHTYADEGSFPVTVNLADDGGGNAFALQATASVAEGDALTAHPLTINPHRAQAFTGTVATFTDTFTANTSDDFAASVDWGDGTTTIGTVSGSNGSFTVAGTHTYANAGIFSMQVTLRDSGPGSAQATADSTANVDVADLSMVKTGPGQAVPGSNIAYTLTAHNGGPNDAANVTLTDATPSGTTFVSATQTSGAAFVCSTPAAGGGGTVSCHTAAFANGATATFTIVVHASPAAFGISTTNTASISSPDIFDPNPNNNTSSVSTTVTCDHVINGSTGSVTASGGSWCLTGNLGTVTVSQGTTAVITNATLSGSIIANNTAGLSLCNSTVGGVTVSGATGFVEIGDPADDLCGGNTINGGVTLSHDAAGVEVSHNNRIGGSVVFNGNAGGGPFPDDTSPELEANVISGSLSCSANSVSPRNDGQPNHTAGAETGQCSGL